MIRMPYRANRQRQAPQPLGHLPGFSVPEPALQSENIPPIEDAGYLMINDTRYDITPECIERRHTLGEGSFGTVVLVNHIPTGTNMALKMIRETIGPSDRKHLVEEINLGRRFNHSCLLPYYGLNVEQGDVQLYTEHCFCSLHDISSKMREIENADMPESIIGHIAVSLVSGLDYMKTEHNALHRDIKPKNVLVSFQGLIKICDYGLVSVTEGSLVYSNVGTEIYLAPERLSKPDAAYDARCDVWAVGLVLLEMIEFEHAYVKQTGSNNAFTILSSILYDPRPRCPDRYSPACQAFIAACLNDVSSRPKYSQPSIDGTQGPLLEHPFITQGHVADVLALCRKIGVTE